MYRLSRNGSRLIARAFQYDDDRRKLRCLSQRQRCVLRGQVACAVLAAGLPRRLFFSHSPRGPHEVNNPKPNRRPLLPPPGPKPTLAPKSARAATRIFSIPFRRTRINLLISIKSEAGKTMHAKAVTARQA